MPIRNDEKFCKHFLGETEKEAIEVMKKYDNDVVMLSNKCALHTGLDKKDLKQEAIIGLARARRDFDFDRSENFRIFVIYKIKDALREYITMQSNNVRIPQYIKDTIGLIDNLKKVVEKCIHLHPYASFLEIWKSSETDVIDKNIQKEIESIRQSIKNLADRSHTIVPQLLDRAEMFPNTNASPLEGMVLDSSCFDDTSEEEKRVNQMYYEESFKRLKEELSKEEFDLLYARFVDGYTIRELKETMGITPESIVVKTNKIVEKLNRKRKRIMDHEDNSSIEEAVSEYNS